jgi:hypothetical protein
VFLTPETWKCYLYKIYELFLQIQTMQVETTEKDEALSAKMQEHANLLHEKDELEKQLLEIRKELEDAYHTIANQVNQHVVNIFVVI